MTVPVAWRQAPEVPESARALAAPWRELLVFLVVLGPVVRSWSLPGGDEQLVAWVAFGGALLLAVVPERVWPIRLLVPVGAGLLLLRPEGELVALWAWLGLWLSDWAVRGRAPLPRLARPPDSVVAPVVVLSVIATAQGMWWSARYVPLLTLSMGVLLTAMATWGGRVHRGFDLVIRRFSHAVGRGVSLVCFWSLGIVVVLVPWAAQRLVGADPLTRGGSASGWRRREHRDAQPREAWPLDRVERERSVWRRIQYAAPGVILVGVGALGMVALSKVDLRIWLRDTFSLAGPPAGVSYPPAHEGEEWYWDLREDEAWALDDTVAWNPLVLHRHGDVATRHVNVVDGNRVTWTPPPCDDCPELTVWVYGGSTTFGLGQRDEHTIPSYLAKVAYDRGYRLEVVNRGVLGQMHWSEAMRLSWDLSTEEAPDLVVFYDGVNDVWGTRQLMRFGLGDSGDPLDPMVADITQELRADAGAPPPKPDGASRVTTTVPSLEDDELGALVAERYERSREMSKAITSAYDLPVAWFWQPSIHTRAVTEGDPHPNPDGEVGARLVYRDAAAGLSDEVINLDDVFSVTDEPLYDDEVHHNELGARIVAEAMFEELLPQLEALAEGGGR